MIKLHTHTHTHTHTRYRKIAQYFYTNFVKIVNVYEIKKENLVKGSKFL